MAKMNIVIDGENGIVKWAVIKALRENLAKIGIKSSCHKLTLADHFVNSLEIRTAQTRPANEVVLVDTDLIFELVGNYYGSGKIEHYSVFNQALDLASANLRPDIVVLIDSLGKDEGAKEIRRGYFWEAKQRDYQIISAVSDIEKVIANIKIAAASAAPAEEAVPLEAILRKRKFPKRKSRHKKLRQLKH